MTTEKCLVDEIGSWEIPRKGKRGKITFDSLLLDLAELEEILEIENDQRERTLGG